MGHPSALFHSRGRMYAVMLTWCFFLGSVLLLERVVVWGNVMRSDLSERFKSDIDV